MLHLSLLEKVQRLKKTSFCLVNDTPAGLVTHVEGVGKHTRIGERENDEVEDSGRNAT